MIFVNEGLVQVSNHPVQLVFDLAMAIKCIYEKIEEDGIKKDVADEMLELAIRFSSMSDEEIRDFLLTLPPDKPLSFSDMINYLDKRDGITYINNGMIS